MDTTPLVIDDIEAGKAFIQRMNNYAPVKAACWLRSAEGGERYLYVALDGLNATSTGPAYDEVARITQEMKDHYIDPFRVKVIGTNDPIAKAIMDHYRRFPGRVPPHVNGPVLGGVAVGEVYIYPVLPAKP